MKLKRIEWASIILCGLVAGLDIFGAVRTRLWWPYLGSAAAWSAVVLWTITSARWRELALDLLKSNSEILELNARLLRESREPWEDN